MARVRLSKHATEESTYIVNVEIDDEYGNLVTPVTLLWTLSTTYGIILNNREDVSVAVPTTSNDIVLSGDDLQILVGKPTETRVFTVKGTYNSAHGSDLPFTGRTFLDVDNLAVI